MKSPMKEVVEELIILRGHNISVTDEYLQNLLQKERDRLYHAFYAGGGVQVFQDYEEEFNKYYDEIYNQNN
jgi:hypothetical protein